MPGTIVHMGLQGVITRRFWPRAELLWIYLGGVSPDLGWILQRAVRRLALPVDPFQLLSYSLVLSSLVACLWLCLAVALLTRRPSRTFAILGLSALFHLLLDAAEAKWSSGVLLGAPFTWRTVHFGWFAQDGWPAAVLIAASLTWVLVNWRRGAREVERADLRPALRGRGWLAAVCVAVYLAWPLPWMGMPEQANLYDMALLRPGAERAGQAIELDRVRYRAAAGGVRVFSGEVLAVTGLAVPDGTMVSVRGVFVSPSTVAPDGIRVHHPWLRDAGTLAGLGLLGAFMLHGLWRRLRGAGPAADGGDREE